MFGRTHILNVSINERVVGTITRLIDETIIFAFDPDYEADLNRPILSLSFKGSMGTLVNRRAATGTRLSPFFSNLLPEGHLRDYLASKLKINASREFLLLAALGLDLPGAVVAQPWGEFSSGENWSHSTNSHDRTPLRFSLAGVQLKFSAIAESKGTFTITANGAGGSWIVKLPSERYLQLPETEFAMLKLARLAGITVPECQLVPTSSIEGLPNEFKNIVADSLAVRRFDRTENGGRIHMEDFAQVYGLYPQDKYEKAGYSHIGRVLWAEDGEDSYCEFIRRLVFSVIIGNGDMHLKNWSLLYQNPQEPKLSPGYDFVPTIAYIEDDTLALNLGGTKRFDEVTIDKFRKMAIQAKAPEKLTVRIANAAIEAIYDTWLKNRFDISLPVDTGRHIDNHAKNLPLLKLR
jgi:serine/threonine-protein kinase HipA